MDPSNATPQSQPVTPQPAPVEPTPATVAPKTNKKLFVVIGAAVAALIAITVLAWFMMQPQKATAENHFKAYWHVLGIENNLLAWEDISGSKLPHDIIAGMYDPDFAYDRTRNNFDKLFTAYKKSTEDTKHLVTLLDADARNIAADGQSSAQFQTLLPIVKKQTAAYVEFQADLERGKDILPKLAPYNSSADHPISVTNLARKMPAEMIAAAEKIRDGIPTLQKSLESYQPQSDLFKTIKQEFTQLLEKQFVTASVLAKSDGSAGALVQAISSLEKKMFDPASLNKKLDDQIGSNDIEKKIQDYAGHLAQYLQSNLGIAKNDFNKKARDALDANKQDLGATTHELLTKIY